MVFKRASEKTRFVFLKNNLDSRLEDGLELGRGVGGKMARI